jgi:hypothetical protein
MCEEKIGTGVSQEGKNLIFREGRSIAVGLMKKPPPTHKKYHDHVHMYNVARQRNLYCVD